MDHRYSIIIVVIIAVSLPIGQSSNPPLTPIQLITMNKYVAEEYKVTTRDGYILSMQRIPYGRSGKPNGTQPVIFLQHGLLCSSTNWISNGPKDSLAFMLADAGFDVWLGNIRGNTFSRSHVRYNPDKDKEFWEFSFDEHSQIDLPAMVDHALSVSQQDSLYYVGHSQGTMMGFAGLTYNQTFAKSIKEFFALAPVSTVGDIKGLFAYLAENYKIILPFLDIFGVGEFVPNQGIIDKFGELFCHSVIDEICSNVLFLICGSDAKNLNDSLLPLYLSHAPAGTSLQNVKHWSQMVKSGNFQMYNYGSDKANKAHYNGQKDPPLYHLEKLQVPTYLFTGGKDYLADPGDVARLKPKIASVLKGDTHIANYDHLDFIWGIDAHAKVYDIIINTIKTNNTMI